MTDMDITLGEVARTLVRLEAMVTRLADSLATLSAVDARVANVESDLHALRSDVDRVTTRSAYISGGVSALAFVAGLWPWNK